MVKIIKKKKELIFSIALTGILYIVLNFNFSIKMAIALSLLTIMLWATNAVDRTVVALFFVFMAFIMGLAPAKVIFKFPMTENFYIIVFSFVISEGVVKSGLAEYTSRKLMNKIVKTPNNMILFSYIAGIILIFFIPQPFPRVILLSAFYIEYLKGQKISRDSKSVLMFSIFTAATFTSMMFLNGDLLLHFVAMEMGNSYINWQQWSMYMTVPSILICIITYFLFKLVFRKELKGVKFESLKINDKQIKMTKEKYITISVLIGIFILFTTQSITGIRAQWILLLGSIAMYFGKIIDLSSFKKVNWKLLIFFVAAFSIGGVLTYSGVVDILCNKLLILIPKSNLNYQIMVIVIISMILHIFLGSAVTTSAIVLPIFMKMSLFDTGSPILTLMVYSVVNMHYLLPFQHATIMIGYGEDFYGSRQVFRYGLLMTLVTFISVILIEVPWWRLIGVI
ncbi:SLC13 family permease [Clostridium sediminicola]|uniref:SLC13 family permease n=1 Tax=Clostridium sediminicola TaxID=3114879 RepID=UPI0031F235B4